MAVTVLRNASRFLDALLDPQNAAILAVMRDPRQGKMTEQAIERGRALVTGARAALSDAAAGKAELPVLTNEVLLAMGECHEVLRRFATHVRGYLRENPNHLPAEEVKSLLASFNALIDGSAGQAALPARVRAVVEAAGQDPAKSSMARLMRDAGIDAEDLAAATRAAGTVTVADAAQESRKAGKVVAVAAKDAIVRDLQGWYSRWSEVAYEILPPEQQVALGLRLRGRGGRRPKRQAGQGPQSTPA